MNPMTTPNAADTKADNPRAAAFLANEQQFRLGELLTEQSHPRTACVAETLKRNLASGIENLLEVDRDISPVLKRTLAGEEFNQLCAAMSRALSNGRRVYFTGCGATGRLSILLESCWRKFWAGSHHSQASEIGDRVRSVMAGGDFALIRSVEGFEDFADFGRHQLREAGVESGDVVVAISEGGETSFVIGTAWDASAFFVFNNPSQTLRQKVTRSREILDDSRVVSLDLATGPMAIAGSTRMQATTIELIVLMAALEFALRSVCEDIGLKLTENDLDLASWAPQFDRLLDELTSPLNLQTIAAFTQQEVDTYRAGGLVTYFADGYLLDVLTDTTERSPTFSLPPFRESDDDRSARSWSFVKHPMLSTPEAWASLLGRPPKSLAWTREDYESMNAPAEICKAPPNLTDSRILRFAIGREPDPSRTEAPSSLAVCLRVGQEVVTHSPRSAFGQASVQCNEAYDESASLSIGQPTEDVGADVSNYFVACDLPPTPLNLWEHVAAKLVLNTLSTAAMGPMGRLKGNWMIYVKTSNKKLIDRGARLIADQAHVSYERACQELFETLDHFESNVSTGPAAESPVAATIRRIESTDA